MEKCCFQSGVGAEYLIIPQMSFRGLNSIIQKHDFWQKNMIKAIDCQRLTTTLILDGVSSKV
jgi:hypothetical protein